MKTERTVGQGSNNNISIFYSSIPNFSITKKLDVIQISIFRDDYTNLLYDFLEANRFKTISDDKLPKGIYDMMRTYRSDDDIASLEIKHGLRYFLKNRSCFPSLLIRIHDAHREIQSLLDSFFKYHSIDVKVSEIEMTCDFYTDYRYKLLEFLKSHLFLKNVRVKPNSDYTTTFYTHDSTDGKGKLASKRMKIYLKELELNGKKVVRMELTIKRNVIKNLGLEFPLSNIDSIDLSKFFSFKVVNEQKLTDYICRKNKKLIEDVEKKKIKGFGGDLVKAHLDSWIRNAVLGEDSLLGNVYSLKSEKNTFPNYSRFLEPLEEINSDFFKRVSVNSFIPNKSEAYR
jgi:hypothetical protein